MATGPNPRNPFGTMMPQPEPYNQARREYDTESEMGDHYGSLNGSTTRLAGNPPYYDQPNGEHHIFVRFFT